MTNREALIELKEYEDMGFTNDMCDREKEAFKMAISALEEQDNRKWIPCSERLPKESKSYLIQCKTDLLSGFFGIHQARYGVNSDKWKASEGNSYFDEVIAWQPLPEPYEAEESE